MDVPSCTTTVHAVTHVGLVREIVHPALLLLDEIPLSSVQREAAENKRQLLMDGEVVRGFVFAAEVL